MNGVKQKTGTAGGIIAPLVVLFALTAIIGGLFLVLSTKSDAQKECEENLQRIYRVLAFYEAKNDALPLLAYFPDDPQNDADSLYVIMESYSMDARICVCPAVHSTLRNQGLTYIWNTQLSGVPLPDDGPPQWMLVEMTAISGEVPAPHLRSYNVLYTDGTVKRVKDPLKELPGL